MPETPASDIDGEPADHLEVLRAALLWSADPDPEYPIACFSVLSSEGDLKITYILITEVQNRLLCGCAFSCLEPYFVIPNFASQIFVESR